MKEKNKSMTIRLDEDLHTAIKVRVAKGGLSLTDYIVGLVEKDLDEFYKVEAEEK